MKARRELRLPEIDGYQLLKCDFHVHTIFSDGIVWPTLRVQEAWEEGLDAIAITDHIEGQPARQHVGKGHNNAFDMAKEEAARRNIILVKGGEITRSMPPGHLNALFVEDVDALDQPDYMKAIEAAHKQGAFIQWNHPGWGVDSIMWHDVHEDLYRKGWLNGIEVYNEFEWYPVALGWANEKDLTLFGNTDVHDVVERLYDFRQTDHRPMTLVLSKDRTSDGIKEALFARRTLVYFYDTLMGREEYFGKSIILPLQKTNIIAMAKIVFKELTSNQNVLFPVSLSEKIAPNHPVRVVNSVVDALDISCLLWAYKGGGTSSYHPRMMLKVLFYAYLNNIYSCRKIEKALQENIHFMWLSGNSTPDFRTINDFRGKRLKEHIKSLFSAIVLLLQESGYVSLDVQYIDGTKVESASNRYTFVWRGSVEKNKVKLESKIQSILSEVDKHIEQDKQERTPDSLPDMDSCGLREKVGALNKRLSGMNKAEQKQIKKLQEEYLPRLAKYESQLEKLGDRNSFSKTDEDATFMRMKEDHMKNGQLKPAYNIQIATENQFITNLGIYRRAGDTGTLISFLKDFRETYHRQSSIVVADAGYGSEQNYEFMENAGIEAFVKYNYFHKEQKRAWKKDAFAIQNLYYNRKRDYYVCPMGQHMEYKGQRKSKSDLGYVSILKRYQAQNCEGCPLKSQCHKSKTNRIIEVNYNLNRYKQKARERLMSEEGIYHRGRRCTEPEAVFAQIKHNSAWNRFRLRGLEKVKTEFTLVAIAHNLRKLAKKSVFFCFLLIVSFLCRN